MTINYYSQVFKSIGLKRILHAKIEQCQAICKGKCLRPVEDFTEEIPHALLYMPGGHGMTHFSLQLPTKIIIPGQGLTVTQKRI